jgi:ankyrin repeat protein
MKILKYLTFALIAVSLISCKSVVENMGIDTSGFKLLTAGSTTPAAREGNTQLMNLVLDSNLKKIKAGFKSGQFKSLINAQNKADMTALNLAAIYSNPEIISYLLKKGADKSIVDVEGFTPTLHAVAADKLKNVKVLINGKFPKEYTNRQSVLHFAAHGGSTKMMKYLLSLAPKSEVRRKDRWKQTPLYIAINDKAALGVCKELISKGTNIHEKIEKVTLRNFDKKRIKNKITYFDAALMQGLYDVAQILEKKGVKRTISSDVYYDGYLKAKATARKYGTRDAGRKLW